MRPDFNRPANDNVIPFTGSFSAADKPVATETVCDAQLLIALLNTVSALGSLIPHVGHAPEQVLGFANASLTMANNAIARMGLTHAR